VPETAITAAASRGVGEGGGAGVREWSVPPGGGGGADASSHGGGDGFSAGVLLRVGLNLSGEGNGGRVRYGAQVSDRWIGLTAQDLRLMIFFFEKYKINVPGSVKVNQFFTSHYFSQCKWFPVLKHTPFFSSYKSF
jgi:hypothetical protein